MQKPDSEDILSGHNLPLSSQTLVIWVVAFGMVAVSLYLGTIIFLLPDITHWYGYYIAEWAVVLQSVVIASLFIFFGRIGDQIGLCVIFRYGLFLLGAGFVCIALIPHPYVYLFSSVLIGVASAMVSSVSGGIIRSTAPKSSFPFGIAIMYLGSSFGFIFGPSLVVLISSFYSWNLFFLIIAPVTFLAAYLTGRICTCSRSQVSLKDIDYSGAGLLILTCFLFMYSLVEVFKFNLSPLVFLSGLLGILTGSFLWYHQKHSKNPFLTTGWYRVPGILHLLGLIIVLVLVYRGAVFLSRIFLQEMVYLDPIITGLILIIPGITFIPLVWLIGTYAQSWQWKQYFRVSVVGVIFGCLGAIALGFFHQWSSIIALLLFGAYNACIRVPMCTLFFARISEEESGLAGGMLETCTALIIPLIVPITGASFCAGYTWLSPPPASSSSMDEIFGHLFWGNLGDTLFFLGCCIVQMVLLIRLSRIIVQK